jgi:pyruvate,water dikinase
MTSIAVLPLVRRFEHIGRSDVPHVGGKGANLGEMRRGGLPVPAGFVVTVEAYEQALSSDGSLERLESLLRDLDVDDTAALQRASDAAREMVRDIVLPEEVRDEILAAYRSLSRDHDDVPVAVRSSATAEDAASASFAGMFESYLLVRGGEDLLRRVIDCWASAFGPPCSIARSRDIAVPCRLRSSCSR